MLKHPTVEKLQTLKLTGMSKAMEEQLRLPEIQSLSFEERLGLLVDQELTERQNRRLQTRLRQAKLRQQACMEDIDWRAARGLDKHMMMDLAACRWIKAPHNVLILGPTGVGKTYLACALAQQACREGYRVQYARLSIACLFFFRNWRWQSDYAQRRIHAQEKTNIDSNGKRGITHL
jgi:DNA replication protein DnaC